MPKLERRPLRPVLGTLAVLAGAACLAIAALGLARDTGRPAAPDPGPDLAASPDFAASPDLNASVFVRDGSAEGARPPTAAELLLARRAIAEQLAGLAPMPVERIPTTSGVGYTLGMAGAAAAIYWTDEDGEASLHCRDVSAHVGHVQADGPADGQREGR